MDGWLVSRCGCEIDRLVAWKDGWHQGFRHCVRCSRRCIHGCLLNLQTVETSVLIAEDALTGLLPTWRHETSRTHRGEYAPPQYLPRHRRSPKDSPPMDAPRFVRLGQQAAFSRRR